MNSFKINSLISEQTFPSGLAIIVLAFISALPLAAQAPAENTNAQAATVEAVQIEAVGTIAGQGTTGKIAKFTGANSIGNSIITESSSKIGIGTATPYFKIDGANKCDESDDPRKEHRLGNRCAGEKHRRFRSDRKERPDGRSRHLHELCRKRCLGKLALRYRRAW